ncbi:hypothetical protein FGO68_gene8718 [Halteria grandinella]|uniref:Uncharacterized protein n=1 Tax=Halteria grandinella TaxID=5974 RepID=A0A8J8NKT8_HALGN|nr:hypothetical protein FGO68_gene8718 [Halteria grandinella]
MIAIKANLIKAKSNILQNIYDQIILLPIALQALLSNFSILVYYPLICLILLCISTQVPLLPYFVCLIFRSSNMSLKISINSSFKEAMQIITIINESSQDQDIDFSQFQKMWWTW